MELSILLQVVLPFAPVLKLARNDLFDKHRYPLISALPASVFDRLLSLYYIPLVMRACTTYSQIVFALLFTYTALLPPCGELQWGHVLVFIWSCAFAVQEVEQALIDAVLAEAETMGVGRSFVLTDDASRFEALGFTRTTMASLPEKRDRQCLRCPRLPRCRQVALERTLEPVPLRASA